MAPSLRRADHERLARVQEDVSKVLEYELGSPEVKAAIAKSKFKDVAGFGTRIPGHILLQDHGDEVAFRNLKILSLRPTP